METDLTRSRPLLRSLPLMSGQQRAESPRSKRPHHNNLPDTPSVAPPPFVSVGPAPDNSDPGTQFIYPKLPDGNIRLLHLLPDRDRDAPLKCQLVDYPLQSMDKRACLYEALSYCWYQSEKPNSMSETTKWISIDGRRLPITENLHDALLRLRDDFFGRVMWVDAVCINQGDMEERGHQVRSMTEIYSKANRVVVWLGEAEGRDHEAFQAIREVGEKLSSPASDREEADHEASRAEVGEKPSPLPREKEEAVLGLLNKKWFRRIWVRNMQ